MKKLQVDHVLRAAGRLTGEKRFIIVGSQALHGRHPDLAHEILRSFEVDLVAAEGSDHTAWLDAIGQDSSFHENFGYYADPVDEGSAALPKGWKGRLVSLPGGDTDGVTGLCLDPHDLAIAKYVARRGRDATFTRELATRGIVEKSTLLSMLDDTPVDEDARVRIRGYIERDFE